MESDTNAGQIEFWNADPGQRWVSNAAALDALHGEVTGVLMRAAALAPGERVLDIGCGGGASSLAAAEAVGPDGSVLGLDISAPLLDRAAARARAAGLAHLDFRRGDAQTEPLAQDGFDAAISRFGMMFFDDPTAAFRNIGAALRPGGRLVFVAWAGPETNPWFTIPHSAAVERLGPLPTPPPPPEAPGPMAFADIARVTGLMRAAGLAGCAGIPQPVGLRVPGGIEAAADLATQVGPAMRHHRDAGGTPGDLAAIRAVTAGRLAPYASADGVRIPATVIVYTAERAAAT